MTGIKSFIGTRQYYKHVIVILLPILLQNVITNFVGLLDNIMVGQVGTEAMSGVAIANQLLFVFNLFMFGGLSGAGIFAAQFFGKGDHEGVRQTMRAKMIIALAGVVLFALVFWFLGGNLIKAFLHEGNEGLDLALTFESGVQYLHIMILELVPFALALVYASTLRESGETVVPMAASIIAMIVNMAGNYILIFGKFGAPELGILGAAIATVIARCVECIILLVYTHKNSAKFVFIQKLYKSFYIEGKLARDMLKKGSPLLANELLWSAGMAILNQCYSQRGLEVVSATNISSTIGNLFSCLVFSIGTTITIIIGQHLGAGLLEEAVNDFKKIVVMSMALCVIVGSVLAVVAPLLSNIYNTTDNVRAMASRFMLVIGIFMPVNAFINCCYFTLRSGGKTIITFIFDSAFLWIGNILVAFLLTRLTDMPILGIYIFVNCMDIIKCFIGFFMIRSRKWVVNLVK